MLKAKQQTLLEQAMAVKPKMRARNAEIPDVLDLYLGWLIAAVTTTAVANVLGCSTANVGTRVAYAMRAGLAQGRIKIERIAP